GMGGSSGGQRPAERTRSGGHPSSPPYGQALLRGAVLRAAVFFAGSVFFSAVFFAAVFFAGALAAFFSAAFWAERADEMGVGSPPPPPRAGCSPRAARARSTDAFSA